MNPLTLIIPTYNRPNFLKRILSYYSSYDIKFNIIIVDSSIPSNKKLNKKILSFFPQLNILYLDHFSPKLAPHYKYAEMVKYVKSKYVCFCPDDDFIVPNGIKEAVDFLEKNSDYAAAHGTYISFYVYINSFGSKNFWWKFVYPYNSIASPNPTRRLISHLTNYYQVLWAVRKTDVVKQAYKGFLKSKVDPYLFGELLPDMLSLIYGKMKRLNNFYAARQAFSTSYSYWPSLMDAINAGTYESEYTKFKKCIVNNLSKISGLSEKKASEIIDSSMKIYIKTTRQEHFMGKLNLILSHFPKLLSSSIRLLHTKYLFSKENQDRIGLINSSSSKYYHDFENIRQSVLNHKI